MKQKGMTNKQFSWVFASLVILSILLTACGGTAPAATAPGETPADEPAAQTSTPAVTATATALPTLGLPRLQGTAAPTPAGEINAASAKNIVELARWGKGVLKDAKLSPDGKTLALSTATGVYLYDAVTLDLIDSLDLEGEAAFSTQFSPDGVWLAMRSQSSQVRLYSLVEKQWGEKFGAENRWVSEDNEFYAFSSDGKSLALMEDEQISILNVQDGSRQKALETTSDWATMRYSGDGQHLVLVSRDYYAVVDLAQGTELVHQELQYIQSFAISPDGAYLVIGYGEWNNFYETLVLDANSGQEISRFRHSVFKTKTLIKDSIPDHLTISPDSKTLAVAYGGSALCLWSLVDGKPLQCLLEAEYGSTDRDTAFTADGREMFSYGGDSVKRWDTAAWQIIEQRAIGDVHQVLFPEGGDVFVTVGTSGWETGMLGQVMLWNVDVKPLYEVQAVGLVRDVRYTPDGEFFLTASQKGIEMWDAQAGSLVKTLEGDATMLRVSWDGKTLAAALADNSVQLYSLPDGEPTFKLEGHTQPVSGLYFDSSQMLVSVSSGETLAWKVDDGSQLVALPDAAGALTVLPTSGGFATLGADLKFSIWNRDDGELISTEARLAGSVAQPLAADMNYYDNNLLVLGKDNLVAIGMNWLQRQWAVPMLAVEPALLRASMTGKLLGVKTEDGLQILDPSSGNEVNKIKGNISAFDFEPKNTSPAVATAQENLVKVWSLTALPEKTLKDFGSSQYTSQLTYLPDTTVPFVTENVQIESDTLVIEKINHALRWFDTRNGNLLVTAETDRDLIAFSPNGKYYASVGAGQNWTPIVRVVDFQSEGNSETGDSASQDNSTPEVQKQATESGNDVQTEKSEQVDIIPQNIQNSWQLGTLSASDNGRVAYAFDNTVEPFVELADGVSGEVLASFSPSKIMAALSADGNQLLLPMANPDDENDPIFTCLDVTDPQNATELWTLNWSKVGSQTSVTNLALTPDGKGAVFGDYNGDIFLVDILKGETVAVLKGHTDQVTSLAFSSDGATLYSSSDDGTLRVWGVSDVPEFIPTPLPTATPYPTATSISAGLNTQFSSQAVADLDSLAVITAENAQNLAQLMMWQITEAGDEYHSGRVFYFNHAPVGGAVFPEATSATTYLIDSNEMLLFDPFSDQPLQAINWSWTSGWTSLAPDGSVFAGTVYYPPEEGETESTKPAEIQLIGANRAVIRSLKQHTLPSVNVLAYTPDGRYLITSATDFKTRNRSEIIVWDTQDDYTRVASLFVDDCLNSMAIEKREDSDVPYYQVFAGTTGEHPNTHLLRFLLTEEGELTASGGKGGFTVDLPRSLAMAPGGQLMAVGMLDGGLKVIGTDMDEEYVSLKVQPFQNGDTEEDSMTLSVTFLPDGKGILTSHWDGSLRLWGVNEK